MGRPARHHVLVAALCGLVAASAAARPVRRLPIVDRAIEHHGGEAYRSSETELDICSASGCFHLRARVDGEHFDHTVTRRTAAGERQARITNDSVELWEDGVPSPVAPEEAQRWRDWVMARVYFPFLPYRLDDPSVWKEDLGDEVWGERTLRRVRVTFDPGSSTDAQDVYLYWFDPATTELVQLAYTFRGHPGGIRFRRLVDGRRIGGILFFDQENFGAEGDGLTVDSLTPETAAELRHVSTVRLTGIEVRRLGGT